jgi:hypothetical protein
MSNYNGLRGGRVRVRAKIGQMDKNTFGDYPNSIFYYDDFD